MIRPWYRSRLFWLGVPGFWFLFWCWPDSMHHATTISVAWEGEQERDPFGPPIHGLSISQKCGQLHFTDEVFPFVPVFASNGMGYEMHRFPIEGLPEDPFDPFSAERSVRLHDWFPPAYSPEDTRRYDALGSAVAIWFLVLVYAISWGAGCFIWQRRKHRLLSKSEGLQKK